MIVHGYGRAWEFRIKCAATSIVLGLGILGSSDIKDGVPLVATSFAQVRNGGNQVRW